MKKIVLKQTPEDFVVEEVNDIQKLKSGNYALLKVKKTNLNTLDIVDFLSRELKIPRNFISFAGTKDKNAITTQIFSVKSIKKESLEKLNKELKINPNIEIEFIGFSDKPLSLGLLTGNKFTITLPFKPKNKINYMPNYFGEQRFSTSNVEIGRFILKKQFKEASELINQNSIKSHLIKNQNDFIGAIKTLDKKLISLYLNAFQSHLWNKAVVNYLKFLLNKKEYLEHEGLIYPKPSSIKKIKNIKDLSIPLISFDIEYKNKTIKDIYEKILKEENIETHEFVIRQFPEQIPVSSERKVFANVKNFDWKNNKLTFELPKGSYATILIKNLEILE